MIAEGVCGDFGDLLVRLVQWHVITYRISVKCGTIARAVVLGYLLSGFLGANLFWESEAKDAKDTSVDEPPFRLTLPGRWLRKPSSNPWVYYTEDGREQLTVSLMGSDIEMNKEQQSDTLKKLVEIHRRTQTKMPDVGVVTMSDTTFAEVGRVLAARYGGVNPAHHRQFASLLLCGPRAITIYYYEASGLTQAEFETRGRTMMNSIVMRDVKPQ
jgi:hypothetical protein